MRTTQATVLIERASKPLHFPKDINSSSMAVNRQAVAQAATRSSVIARNLPPKQNLVKVEDSACSRN